MIWNKDDKLFNTNQVFFASMIPLLYIMIFIVLTQDFKTPQEELREQTIRGKIDCVYIDHKNHAGVYASINKTEKFGIGSINMKKVQKGDSIYKDSGSLKVMIVKPNSHRIIIDYEY